MPDTSGPIEGGRDKEPLQSFDVEIHDAQESLGDGYKEQIIILNKIDALSLEDAQEKAGELCRRLQNINETDEHVRHLFTVGKVSRSE